MDASLLDRLDEFRTRAENGSAWIQAREWIQARAGFPIRETELKLAICRHGAFLMDDRDWSLHLKTACFSGRDFFVFPTDFELAQGVFLPGGNLLPFLPYDLHPAEAEFRYQGLRLPPLSCELPEKDLERRYAFFGKEEAFVLIGIDGYEANPKAGEPAASPFLARTRIIDAAAVYADPAFSAERGLVLRMTEAGVYVVRPARAEDAPGKAQKRKNHKALASAFDRVFAFFGPEIGMDGQIAQAYWFAFGDEGSAILPAFTEFMESEWAPAISALGMDTLLCPPGAEAELLWASEGSAHPDPSGRDANRILESLGLPLRTPEIEAMIRSLPNADPDEVMENLSGVFSNTSFFAQRKELLSCLKGLAAYAKSSADPFQEPLVRPLREQALGHLLGSLQATARLQVGAGASREKRQDLVSVNQLISELRGIIAFLNAPSPLSAERLSELSGAIGEIGAALDILISALSTTAVASIDPSRPMPRAAAPRKRPAAIDSDAFTLSLSLAGLKPPVSRVLSVPGGASLAFLSECVLAAFSWSGRHLHCFRIGEEIFGKRDANSLAQEFDEAEAFLGNLGLRKGSRFEYEYDFGSSWIVIVSVSGTCPPEKTDRPACISGRGASPPEDCGGPLAYARLLAAWKNKTSADYDRLKRTMGAAWDPVEFEPRAVNAALESLYGQGSVK
jgi:hypothetical protein